MVTKISQEPKVVTIDQINAATAEKAALESAQSTVNPLAQSQAEAYSGTAAMAPGLNLELLFSSGGVMVWRKGAKTFLTRIVPGVGAALTLYEIGSKVVESIRSNPGYFADILAHGIDSDGPDAIATLMRKNLQRGNKGANLPVGQKKPDESGHDPDPKDPKDLRYNPAPYHHKNAQGGKVGGKSRGPTEGQKTLDKSVKVGENSDRRVGVDPKNEEIVVFDKTGGKEYHGHVRNWGELTEKQKNVLFKEGLTDLKGNIK